MYRLLQIYGELLKTLFLKSGTSQGWHAFIWLWTRGVLASAVKLVRKRKNMVGKEKKNVTVLTCKWCDSLPKESLRSYWKIMRIYDEETKLLGLRFDIKLCVPIQEAKMK